MHNIDNHRGGATFSLPVCAQGRVQNIGFRDIDTDSGNDWTASPGGEDYLSRIPPAAHRALGRLRAFHLRATQKVLRRIEQGRRDVVEFACH